jgi:hypothetical protein
MRERRREVPDDGSRGMHSLATVVPGTGQRYHVRRILFEEVRERCTRLGIAEGMPVVCRARSAGTVHIELPGDGASRHLPLRHAWFVQVEPAPGPLVA